MSYILNNQQKVNDIVFLGRNQNYGAYVLRSNYGETVLKSLLIIILGCGFLCSAVWYLSANPQPDPSQKFIIPPKQDSIYEVWVNNKPQEKKQLKSEEKQTIETTKKQENTDSRIIIIDSLKTESVLNDSLNEKAITSTTGTKAGKDTVSDEGQKGDGKKTVKKDSILEGHRLDAQPEFEGGIKALYSFISTNLKYPEIASSGGRGGTVYVKFVVDQTGKVGRWTLLNRVGYDMDEEALRVVSIIPKFKSPGIINGEAVSTYFLLPIKFRLR